MDRTCNECEWCSVKYVCKECGAKTDAPPSQARKRLFCSIKCRGVAKMRESLHLAMSRPLKGWRIVGTIPTPRTFRGRGRGRGQWVLCECLGCHRELPRRLDSFKASRLAIYSSGGCPSCAGRIGSRISNAVQSARLAQYNVLGCKLTLPEIASIFGGTRQGWRMRIKHVGSFPAALALGRMLRGGNQHR